MNKKASIFKKDENEDKKYMPFFLDPENFINQLKSLHELNQNNKRSIVKDDQTKDNLSSKKQRTK